MGLFVQPKFYDSTLFDKNGPVMVSIIQVNANAMDRVCHLHTTIDNVTLYFFIYTYIEFYCSIIMGKMK